MHACLQSYHAVHGVYGDTNVAELLAMIPDRPDRMVGRVHRAGIIDYTFVRWCQY